MLVRRITSILGRPAMALHLRRGAGGKGNPPHRHAEREPEEHDFITSYGNTMSHDGDYLFFNRVLWKMKGEGRKK